MWARALLDRRQLPEENGWSAHCLGLMAQGLGKGEGTEVQQALTGLARVVVTRQLVPQEGLELALSGHDGQWAEQGRGGRDQEGSGAPCTGGFPASGAGQRHPAGPPHSLSLMANALARGEGPEVREALVRLAQLIPEAGPLTPERGLEQPVPGPDDQCPCPGARAQRSGRALTHLARALCDDRPLTIAAGWTARCLSMMAHGLRRGEGVEVQQALTRLARVVEQQDLQQQGWTLSGSWP